MFGSRAFRQLAKNARMAHVSAAPPKESSLLGTVWKSKMPRIPLDQQFGEVPQHVAIRAPESAAQTTILSNGVTVVSTNTPHALAQVTVTMSGGSRYEDSSNHGTASFLAAVAQKSTSNRSEFRAVRENHSLGNQIKFTADRENITITASALQEHVPHLMGSIGDVLANGQYLKHEIYPVKDMYREFICEHEERNPCQIEAIHAAAYYNNTLGHPLKAVSSHLDSISTASLKAHAAKYFTGPNMVISAVGVEHARLLDSLSESFVAVPASGPEIVQLPAQYTGGEVRISQSGEDGLAHYTLGFAAPGQNSNQVYSAMVLAHIMNNGRLTALSNSVLGAQCNNFVYSDSSLFTLTGSALSGNGQGLSDFLVSQSIAMADVTDAEVAVAKAQLQTSALLAAEYNSNFATGPSTQETVAALEAVSTADVKQTATTVLQSALSTSASGDLSTLPPAEQIKSNFPTLLA